MMEANNVLRMLRLRMMRKRIKPPAPSRSQPHTNIYTHAPQFENQKKKTIIVELP